jgi:hypothetical protein
VGRGPDGTTGFRDEVERQAEAFFEPGLRKLGLSVDQIEEQDLHQLEVSLARIDDAMHHPGQFGTFRAKVTSSVGGGLSVVIPKVASEAQVEVGILPILLSRKSLVLDRIKLLRPEDQIADLRGEIIQRVADEKVREELLRVLDKRREEEQEQSNRLQREASSVQEALEVERRSTVHAVALAELKLRVESLDMALKDKSDALDKGLTRLEDRSVSKWDVVTIVFTTLAALGGIVAAALGIAKWIAGG